MYPPPCPTCTLSDVCSYPHNAHIWQHQHWIPKKSSRRADMQARLHQAESLIQQQRLTIDRLHSCSGRNSKNTGAVGHMRQSENDYWRSWLQCSAECTSQQEESPQQTHLPQNNSVSPVIIVPSKIKAACTQPGKEGTPLPHVAGLHAPACGRNSAAVSSTASSHNARHHRQKQADDKHYWIEPLSSNDSLVNLKPCAEQSFKRGACQLSGCQSCGWQPGINSLKGVAASHYRSDSEDLLNS